MMVNKTTPSVDYNWLKRLDIQVNKITIQNSLKFPKSCKANE